MESLGDMKDLFQVLPLGVGPLFDRSHEHTANSMASTPKYKHCGWDPGGRVVDVV